MKTAGALVLFLAYLTVGASAAGRQLRQEEAEPACTIGTETVAALAEAAGLTTLLAAAEAAGLSETLSDPAFAGTIFAPSNEGFEAGLGALNTTAEQLQEDGVLNSILLYHIVAQTLPGAEVVAAAGTPLATLLEGQTLTVAPEGESVYVQAAASQALVTTPDQNACQAIIHVIDYVLVPDLPTLSSAPAPAPEATEGAESTEVAEAVAPDTAAAGSK